MQHAGRCLKARDLQDVRVQGLADSRRPSKYSSPKPHGWTLCKRRTAAHPRYGCARSSRTGPCSNRHIQGLLEQTLSTALRTLMTVPRFGPKFYSP